MLRTLAIISNQFVLSFGVLIAFWSPKQFEIEESYLESMAKQWKSQKHEELKLWSPLLPWVNPECKEKKQEICHEAYSWWQSCQPLLKHFLKSNFYMLYVVSKIRKSIIQCFKWCTIWSWNEGVTAIASRSLQAEGRILHSAAKSPFCCEMISQPFCTVLWNSS